MKKKVLWLCAAVLAVCLFGGCGKGTENDQDTVQTSGSGQQVEDASEMESQGDRGSQEKQENDYGLEEQEVFE